MQEKGVKTMFGWQRKVYDGIKPIIEEFATKNKGTIFVDGEVTNIRILTSQGYVTIQIGFRGRNEDCKIEVTGIRRSGYETKRTLLPVTDQKIDASQMGTALLLALYGE